MTAVGHIVYFCGGMIDWHITPTVSALNLVTKEFKILNSMAERRWKLSTAVLENGNILAMGGENSRTAEIYDPKSNEWETIAPMLNKHSEAASTTLNGKVYIAGGRNGSELLNAVECYNPQKSVGLRCQQ